MSKLPDVPPGSTLHLPFSLNATVGALEIGVLCSMFLFGVLTVQVYIYFTQFPRDPNGFKSMVAMVWLLDLGHTIAICHCIYTITVTNYGQPVVLALPPKSLDISIFLSGLIGPLEQGWFTYRLYKFTRTFPLPILCITLSLLRLGGSTGLFVVSLAGPTIQNYLTRLKWLIEAVVIVGALVDVILAVALCYHLSFWRKGGFQRTNKLVNQLMTWTIETGAITSVGAVTVLVTFLAMENNLVYGGVFFLMAKLFSNSLLFSLNARQRFARICAESMILPGSTQQHSSIPSLELSPLSAEPSKFLKWRHAQNVLTPLSSTYLGPRIQTPPRQHNPPVDSPPAKKQPLRPSYSPNVV
ncbi:Glycoside hydrolase [Mycena venus]|uniref:Glycoside hydrolase n=1 Tax=Mycena venus TaxID=2733690 RepID=A0A8H6YE31_9AGAR|nr:Glycoside hydrolase [Mycena venus]